MHTNTFSLRASPALAVLATVLLSLLVPTAATRFSTLAKCEILSRDGKSSAPSAVHDEGIDRVFRNFSSASTNGTATALKKFKRSEIREAIEKYDDGEHDSFVVLLKARLSFLKEQSAIAKINKATVAVQRKGKVTAKLKAMNPSDMILGDTTRLNRATTTDKGWQVCGLKMINMKCCNSADIQSSANLEQGPGVSIGNFIVALYRPPPPGQPGVQPPCHQIKNKAGMNPILLGMRYHTKSKDYVGFDWTYPVFHFSFLGDATSLKLGVAVPVDADPCRVQRISLVHEYNDPQHLIAGVHFVIRMVWTGASCPVLVTEVDLTNLWWRLKFTALFADRQKGVSQSLPEEAYFSDPSDVKAFHRLQAQNELWLRNNQEGTKQMTAITLVDYDKQDRWGTWEDGSQRKPVMALPSGMRNFHYLNHNAEKLKARGPAENLLSYETLVGEDVPASTKTSRAEVLRLVNEFVQQNIPYSLEDAAPLPPTFPATKARYVQCQTFAWWFLSKVLKRPITPLKFDTEKKQWLPYPGYE